MNEIEIVQQLFQLPMTVILGGVVVFLWRKLDTIQTKYESVLIEIGKLKGQVDIEERIEVKLDQLLGIKNRK